MKPAKPVAMPEASAPLFSGVQSLNVQDDEYNQVTRARVRILLGLGIFAVILFLLITRLAEVSMFRKASGFYGGQAENAPHRADVLDRNGELLTTTLDTYSVYADARQVWDPQASTDAILSALPQLDRDTVYARLTSGRAFVWISRNLTPRERQAVFALGLPELKFQIEPQRVYPRGRLAAHVLGFTDIDMNGVAGVERAFAEELSAAGAAPQHLSIDMRVQYALDEELRQGTEKFLAKASSGVVLNIKTGEILAMASFPDFDPNAPDETLPQNRLNRASMSVYELGSTFKPISIALALEHDIVQPGEKLPVQKPLIIQKKLIKDDHPSAVPLSLDDVLAKSSNRGTTLISLAAGEDAQQALLRNLGLFDRVPFELSESAAPILPGEWQDITTATVSYGHGISVTPLALATAIGALLNGGDYVAPTLRRVEPGTYVPSRRAVSPQTSQKLVDMMRYVVTNGTGRNASVDGYEIMGKTGSADKLVNGEYALNTLVTSFAGAFPHRDPTYLVFIVYDEPKAIEGTYGYATAGWNAARTSGAVIERIAPILGVTRTDPNAQIKALAAAGGTQ